MGRNVRENPPISDPKHCVINPSTYCVKFALPAPVYVTFTKLSDGTVDSQVKLVEKAVETSVARLSARDLAVALSVSLNEYIKYDWAVEKARETVVTFVQSALFMSSPLGKCTKELLIEETILMVATVAVVQLTPTITLSETCGEEPSTAFALGTLVRLVAMIRKQIVRKPNMNHFMEYPNPRIVVFVNKTSH
jgi:hypothetical protein